MKSLVIFTKILNCYEIKRLHGIYPICGFYIIGNNNLNFCAMTKNHVKKVALECGGDPQYSGKLKTMFIYHLKDKWTFNVRTAYLFDSFKIVLL